MYGADFSVWSFGFAGAAYLLLTLHLIRLSRKNLPRTASAAVLLGAAGLTSLWGWFEVASALVEQPLLTKAASFFDVVRYNLWIAFLLLIRPVQRETTRMGCTPLDLVALALTLTSLLIQGGEFFELNSPWIGNRLIPMISMGLAVFGLVLVEQVFRGLPQDSRWNIKPICAGLIGLFGFDIYMYSEAVIFGQVDADLYGIRGVMHALMIPLFYISMNRVGNWFSQLRVSRSAAFHSAALLVCGLYLLFISGVGYYVKYFGGDWGRALQLCFVFLSIVFLITLLISSSIRAKLQFYLSKNFFRYRYDYREEWLKFTQALCAQNTPQEMGRQVIQGLADLVESTGGGLWIINSEKNRFQQISRWNMDAQPDIDGMSSELHDIFTRENSIIDLEEYRATPGRYGTMLLPFWVQSIHQAWLMVPLIVGDELIGFVLLLRARIPFDANWEVRDLLKTASRQAASFLAQMMATEALLEARKFDAFNRMSAFVVHDLKNIVTQLSLMMKNAKRLHANPEFQQDMLDTVDNSLEKMRQLMVQLREGATPAGTPFGVDLCRVVRRIESIAGGRGRHLEIRHAEPLTLISRGHEERIERVIGHMVHNALDATEPDGKVWLELDKFGDRARVVIGDTGCGMTNEFMRDHLFKPFQSTKPTGMGIGAYESSQYIQELGGKISVVSEIKKGTEVTLLIPLFIGGRSLDLEVLKVH